MYFTCLLSSFRPLGVAELVSAFLVFNYVPDVDVATVEVSALSLIGLIGFSS